MVRRRSERPVPRAGEGGTEPLAPLPLRWQSPPRDLSPGNHPFGKARCVSPGVTDGAGVSLGRFFCLCGTERLLLGVCAWKKCVQLGSGSSAVPRWVWRCWISRRDALPRGTQGHWGWVLPWDAGSRLAAGLPPGLLVFGSTLRLCSALACDRGCCLCISPYHQE